MAFLIHCLGKGLLSPCVIIIFKKLMDWSSDLEFTTTVHQDVSVLSMDHTFFNPPSPAGTRNHQQAEDFRDLEATELYCPTCAQAVPVNKFLLLVLPDGDRYEYRCRYCGTKVGDKTDRKGQFHGILKG